MIGLALILSVFPYKLWINFPLEVDGIRKSIGFIRENYTEGQAVYVYYYSIGLFEYYEKTGRSDFGESVILGSGENHEANWYADIGRLKDNKGMTWLLFSHLFLEDKAFQEIEEVIRKNNGEIKLLFRAPVSGAYLVDFQD
jgi:hypothetical protein